MKITAIESLQWTEYPRLLFVQVHTDAGITGLGETVEKTAGSKGALHGTIAPLMLGQDPLDIEGIWRFAFDNIMYHGYGGAELRALSAVEIALWDVVGKKYNAPLVDLLGGKCRSYVPTYNTCLGFGPVDDYQKWHQDAGELARSLLGEGIRAMKIWPFDRFSEKSLGQYICPKDIEEGLVPVRQIREAADREMEIGIECHFRWNRFSIERIARALEPFNILFIEDPMAPTLADEIKAFSRRTTIPVVGSEMLLTRWQVREWLEKHVSQILMTDVLWNGGIGETLKIAAMAEAFGVPIILHNVAGPVCHAACVHLGAHVPNLIFVESARALYKTYFGELSDYTPRLEHGAFTLPGGPGLGLSLRPGAMARPSLIRQISEGAGIAPGRRAIGDYWAHREFQQ
jgi:galactonate dehydratase